MKLFASQLILHYAVLMTNSLTISNLACCGGKVFQWGSELTNLKKLYEGKNIKIALSASTRDGDNDGRKIILCVRNRFRVRHEKVMFATLEVLTESPCEIIKKIWKSISSPSEFMIQVFSPETTPPDVLPLVYKRRDRDSPRHRKQSDLA